MRLWLNLIGLIFSDPFSELTKSVTFKQEKQTFISTDLQLTPTDELGRFATVSHSRTNGLHINLTPILLKNNRLQMHISSLITKKSAADHAYVITASFFLVGGNGKLIRVLSCSGLDEIKDKKFSYSGTQKVSNHLDLSVSKTPLAYGFTVEKSNRMTSESYGLNTVQVETTNDFSVKFEFDSHVQENTVAKHELDLFYQVDSEVEKLMFSFEVLGKKGVLLSNFTYQLSRAILRKKVSGAVVGAVVGYPNCGKTSLINQARLLSDLKEIPLSSTPYLDKHEFRNVQLDHGKNPSDFVILDTRGYFFKPTDDHDQQLLEKFVHGLRANTEFDTESLPGEDAIDLENAVTDLILLFFGPDLLTFKESNWVFGSSTIIEPSHEKIQELCSLYRTCVSSLATKYPDAHTAKKHILVLITHTDMIPKDKIKLLMSEINLLFDIPKNFVYYSGTECEWIPRDVFQFRETTASLLKQAKENKCNELEYIKQYSESHLEYNKFRESNCIKTNCKHRFTAESVNAFKKILFQLVSPK